MKKGTNIDRCFEFSIFVFSISNLSDGKANSKYFSVNGDVVMGREMFLNYGRAEFAKVNNATKSVKEVNEPEEEGMQSFVR